MGRTKKTTSSRFAPSLSFALREPPPPLRLLMSSRYTRKRKKQMAAKGKDPALALMLSDMDPLMASLVALGQGHRSDESDAFLREAFGRGGLG